LNPERRHAGQAGNLLLRAGPNDVARQEIVEQDDLRADRKGGRNLAETGVEAERQHRQNSILDRILEILADASRARDQIAMGENHAFWVARTPRGIKYR